MCARFVGWVRRCASAETARRSACAGPGADRELVLKGVPRKRLAGCCSAGAPCLCCAGLLRRKLTVAAVAEEEPDFASLIKVGTDVEALILGSEPEELVASCDAVLAEIDGALRTIADSARACKDRVDDVERGLQVGSPRHICARTGTAFEYLQRG